MRQSDLLSMPDAGQNRGTAHATQADRRGVDGMTRMDGGKERSKADTRYGRRASE